MESDHTIRYLPAYSLSYLFMEFLSMNFSNFSQESKHIWGYFRNTLNFFCTAAPMCVHLGLCAGQVLPEIHSLYLVLGKVLCPAVHSYNSVFPEAVCGHCAHWDSRNTPQLHLPADAPPAGNRGLSWSGTQHQWELWNALVCQREHSRKGLMGWKYNRQFKLRCSMQKGVIEG